MATDEEFRAAAEAVQSLTRDPGNDVKLKLYGLYKQATAGDVAGRRPGFTNPVGRAKYDAWAAVTGTDPAEARAAYVALVDSLRAAD